MGALEPVDGKVSFARVGSDEWSKTLSDISLIYDEFGTLSDVSLAYDEFNDGTKVLGEALSAPMTMSMEFKMQDPKMLFLLMGKPQKWMYPRARQFRAARRGYRRWKKAQSCT